MKKSILMSYIISAILIVLSFVLIGFSIYAAYTTQTYRIGNMLYTSTTLIQNRSSVLLRTFGNMSFILGLVGIVASTIALVTSNKNQKVEEKKEYYGEYVKCDECDGPKECWQALVKTSILNNAQN